MIRSSFLATALVVSALSLPGAVLAQTSTAPVAGAAQPSRQDMVEQRIADMHATLHVTSAQDPAFEKLAQIMRDNAQTMDTSLEHRAATIQSMTAVQNLDAYAQVAEEHAQDVQKLSSVFKAFYAELTPAQQKAADEIFRMRASERASQVKPGG